MHRIDELRIDDDRDRRSGLIQEEDRSAAELVSELTEQPDAERHAEDGHGRPHRRAGERVAEPRRQIRRQPDHHAVVAEVLHRAEDEHAETDLGRLSVLDQQRKRIAGALLGLLDEDRRLAERIADHESDDRRQNADGEHAAPADERQQDRRDDRREQHARLPAEADIGRHSRALRGRPGFGRQRHADAELATETEPGDGAINQQIPIALREGAQAGEDREQQNGPGQHADAAEIIAENTEHHAANDRADQCPGH